MTPLGKRLIARIEAEGPLPISDYMATCLMDPADGYYTTRDPLGAAGDFTTAPEVGQVFGELLGLWLAVAWQQAGSPDRFTLVELGPGHGTLMADALRATRRVPGFLAAAEVILVEASPTLQARQASHLERGGIIERPAPRWVATLADVPRDRPLFLLANEFLDALPVDQAVRRGDGWKERRVGHLEAGRLGFVDGAPFDPAGRPDLPPRRVMAAAAEGTVIEIPTPALHCVGEVADRLVEGGGAALFLDYGAMVSGSGDTVQAMARHRFTDPFDAPGEADLTVQVDFARMARAAGQAGAVVWPGLRQAALLTRLGIAARTAALVKANPSQAEALQAAQDRLIGDAAMGTLFKAFAVTGGPLAPAGFDARDPHLELDPEWPR